MSSDEGALLLRDSEMAVSGGTWQNERIVLKLNDPVDASSSGRECPA